MRSEPRSNRNGVRRRAASAPAAGPAVNEELLTIPRLGRVRLEALAAAGVTSLDDLRKMSIDDLAGIKWIGPGNARLIKGWLDTNGNGAGAPSEPKPATRASRTAKSTASANGRGRKAAAASTPAETETPKPRSRKAAAVKTDAPAVEATARPRRSRAPKAQASVPAAAPVTPETTPDEPVAFPDLLTADVERVDTAVSRLKDAIPKKSREKKLGRQLKKVAQSVLELPHSAGDLAAEGKLAAAEALDRIAILLNNAVESGKLSAKKQEAMSSDLKKFRKRLEKALGG